MTTVQHDIDWQSTKKSVLERNRHMFNNSDMSDISFTCQGSRKIFYAHRYVLATSSAVFHAMFYGDLPEKNSVLHLSDTDEKTLEEFLRFLYTDECDLTADNVISIMYLSKKYLVPALMEQCLDLLGKGLDPENVLSILEQAILFDEKDFEEKCWKFVDWHLKEILPYTDNFVKIRLQTLSSLLKRNSLIIKETHLFKAVLKWIDFQCLANDLELTIENRRSVIGEAVYDLRFFAMSEKMFSKHVVNSGLLTSGEVEAIQGKMKGDESPGIQWHPDVRKHDYEILVFNRFRRWDPVGCEYNGEPEFVCFTVDRDVLFHGVRLYGSMLDNHYKVILEIEDVKFRGMYKSKKMQDGLHGYCVMLDLPVFIEKDKLVKISASITGPPGGFGFGRINPLKAGGVTLVFYDHYYPTEGMSMAPHCGQFHKIMLSICDL